MKPVKSFFLRLIFISLPILISADVWGQNNIPVGQWKAWTSHNSTKMSTWRSGVFYTLSEGGMFAYSQESGEFRTYTTVEGLSGLDASCIYYDDVHDIIVIGYENGSVNYFKTPDQIELIMDIRRTQLFGNKRINSIAAHGRFLYLATGFGIVQYDLERKETRNTFAKIGNNEGGGVVSNITISMGRIYVTTPLGLYSAELTFPNLADGNAWQQESVFGYSGGTGTSRLVTGDENQIYCNYNDTIFKYSLAQGWERTILEYGSWKSLNFNLGILCGIFDQRINVLYPDAFLAMFMLDNPVHVFPNPHFDKRVFICQKNSGWWAWDSEFWTFQISMDGPTNNYSTELAVGKDEFYIAPRGFGVQYDNSGIYYYNNSEGWKILNDNNSKLTPQKNNLDYVSAVYDHSNGKAWMGSFQQGIAELKGGELLNFYDGTNSGIRGRFIENGIYKDIRVHDMNLDSKGNLWFTTEFGAVPLQMRSVNGEWYGFTFQANGERVKWLAIDDADFKWVSIQGTGLVVYDDRGTPGSPASHRQRLLTTEVGQGALPSNLINCITKDRNGRIWIGTSTGVAVFNNPRGVFTNSNIDAQRPVFNRRPLFTNEAVTCIAVDGQNRKWVGTRNGAFLMSEDGTQQLLEFNTENSPLFSNSIVDIAINKYTGEVFFSTEFGLISYMGDATEPEETCDEIEVFPNPFYIGHHEVVSFRGLAEYTSVRITTESGLLVQELESTGGQAIWNGRDVRGSVVYPGVYLVLAADRENKNACISKIAVLNNP